jgi:hypothetical protein
MIAPLLYFIHVKYDDLKLKGNQDMFILKGKEQLEKAVARAKQIKPTVKFDHFGRYRVSGSKGGYYTVICKKSDNGYKTVECTCKAGDKNLICFHAAAALAVHIGIAKQRIA